MLQTARTPVNSSRRRRRSIGQGQNARAIHPRAWPQSRRGNHVHSGCAFSTCCALRSSLRVASSCLVSMNHLLRISDSAEVSHFVRRVRQCSNQRLVRLGTARGVNGVAFKATSMQGLHEGYHLLYNKATELPRFLG
jgi:hypothetical protein